MEFLDFERHLIWPRIRAIQAQMEENRRALARCEILALRLRFLRQQGEAGPGIPLVDIIGE